MSQFQIGDIVVYVPGRNRDSNKFAIVVDIDVSINDEPYYKISWNDENYMNLEYTDISHPGWLIKAV